MVVVLVHRSSVQLLLLVGFEGIVTGAMLMAQREQVSVSSQWASKSPTRSTATRPSGCIARIEPGQQSIRGIDCPTKVPVRRRKGRRRAVGARAPAPVLALPNQRWSLDFVHDLLATGRRFRLLNIVDDVTRASPLAPLAAVVDTSISGRRVVRELGDLIATRGKPKMIVSDNAPS